MERKVIMHMRFNKRNWIKFFDGSNKKTTLRLKPKKIGHYQADAGSYYNPKKLGEFDLTKIEETVFGNLKEQDAINDGFENIDKLKKELIMLNGKIEDNVKVWKHWIENPKQASLPPQPKGWGFREVV